MAQCKHSSPKKPTCKMNALRGSDFCMHHQAKSGSVKGLPTGPGVEGTGATAAEPEAGTAQPRVGVDRLLAGQQERQRERKSALVLEDPGKYVVSNEEIGARVAVLMHRAEQKSRDAYMRRGQPNRDSREEYEGFRLDDGDSEERRQPMKVLTRRQRPDPTRIVDPVTKLTPDSLRPDFVQKWVSVTDWNDRPTEHRVAEMEDYNYEFVTDARGRPIESRYGVAMQGPPEEYAARMLDRTPTGAFQRDESLASADEIAKAINRKLGHDDAVTIVPERDHGRRYSAVPLGREKEFDV